MTERFRCIAIAGKFGTGTTTLAQALSGRLGWEFKSPASKLFRELTQVKGISSYGEIPDKVDIEIDASVKEQLREAKDTVFEGRMVGFLASEFPDVFRVLLTASLSLRLHRVTRRDRSETEEKLLKRDKDEEKKYLRIYGVNPLSPEYFDLAISTNRKSVNILAKLVIEGIGVSS